MQRSSNFVVGQGLRGKLFGVVGKLRDYRRCMASNPWDYSGRQGGRGKSGGRSEGAGRSDSASPIVRKDGPRASATSIVTRNASFVRVANQGALERRINREDNMWHDRSQSDTMWLNPRHPSAYRPNFRPTEPKMLRNQFMRSPDEVSRELLGRDWEVAVKAYRRSVMNMVAAKRNQRLQQQQKQEHQKKKREQKKEDQKKEDQRKKSQFYPWGVKPSDD